MLMLAVLCDADPYHGLRFSGSEWGTHAGSYQKCAHGPDCLPISSQPRTSCFILYSSSHTPIHTTKIQLKTCRVQERILRLIRPRLELLALLALSVLAGDRTGLGVSIQLSILLVVRMANLTTKRKVMLNSLAVRYSICSLEAFYTNFYPTKIAQDAQVVLALHPPSSIPSDDDFSSQSDVVEFRPHKRTHINLDVPGNNHGRPLIRRHSPAENRQSTGSGQQSGTQADLHTNKRVQTELAWQQPRSLEDRSSTSEPQTPSDSASATSEGKLPRKFWKREFIPPENILIYDAAKLYLQAEVYTGQPWPSAAVMENMIERAWSLALDQRKREKEEYYRSGDQRPAEQTPSILPDAISLEMVSP